MYDIYIIYVLFSWTVKFKNEKHVTWKQENCQKQENVPFSLPIFVLQVYYTVMFESLS